MFSVLGDWTRQTNWGARNSSFLERDSDARLKGFDDRQRVVEIVNPRTGAHGADHQNGTIASCCPWRGTGSTPAGQGSPRCGPVPRDLRSSIDARLQSRVSAILRAGIERGGHARGAATVLDVETGEVLASVSYPWPELEATRFRRAAGGPEANADALLDRARYGLYPPGSAFKLLVAGAALRAGPAIRNADVRVRATARRPGGQLRQGWTRPVRDDPMDTAPHGDVGLQTRAGRFVQRVLRAARRCASARSRSWTPQRCSRSSRRGRRPPRPCGERCRTPDTVRPTCSSRRSRWRASPPSIAGRGLVAPRAVDCRRAAVGRAARSGSSRRRTPPPCRSYMREAVTSGTGRTLAANATPIAGKTGTAEVDNGRAHSWFAGFAPFGGTRQIAFAVIVENAGLRGARGGADRRRDRQRGARTGPAEMIRAHRSGASAGGGCGTHWRDRACPDGSGTSAGTCTRG